MMNEDLDVFLDEDEFAVTAEIIGLDVVGIMSEEYVMVNFVESKKPVFDCKESDVYGVTHGSSVVIDSSVYQVVGIQPDGTGMTRLILELQ